MSRGENRRMRWFRFPTFRLFEPIGLFDYFRAIDELKEMVRQSAAAEEAADKARRENRDDRPSPAGQEPQCHDRDDDEQGAGDLRSEPDAKHEEGRR